MCCLAFKLRLLIAPFGIFKLFLFFFFWLLCCQAFKLRLLIALFGIFKLLLSFFFSWLCCLAFKLRFWLPLWRLQAFLVLFLLVIVLSGLQITASDYPFGVFKLFLSFFIWLLCCLAFKWRLLITLLASSSFSCPFSFGYCVVWPSNDGFWLPLWRLQAFLVLFLLVIVLSGLQITASDYPFGIFKLFLSLCWLLCCLAFKLRLLITPLASSNLSYHFSFGYCVVWPSNYGFWLPLWYLQTFRILFLLVIVLSGLQITASDYPFGVFKLFLSFFFWLLCCLAFQLRFLLPLWHLQTFLILFLLVIVLSGLQKYGFWLPLWRLQAFLVLFRSVIVLSGLQITLLITPLASSSFSCPFSFGYCVVWPSNYGFWLSLWRLQAFLVLFLLVIVLSGLQITASDYPFGVFKLFLSFFLWLLCCLAFQLRLCLPVWRLQAFLVLFPLVIVLSGLQITPSDYLFGVFKLFLSFFFWLLCCLAFKLRLLIAPFGIFKHFLLFFFWLLCCQAFKLRLLIALFGIFKLLLSFFFSWLCCLAFKLRLLITPLASSSFSCPFSFGYCVVWPSNYGFWLPFWRLQAFLVLFHLVIVLSGLQITASDYLFGVFKLFLSFFFWLLCCLAFKLRLLIAPLASSSFSCSFSFGYCVVRPLNYGFW